MSLNPQKILKNRYQVVARTLILLINDDKVLLQKGSPTKRIWAGFYNGLGGHIERGEDVISAARRETFEESGLEVKDLRLNGVVMIDVEADQGICMFVLSGSKFTGSLRPSNEGELEWININELDHYNCVEDISILVPRVIKNEFFSLQYLYERKWKIGSEGREVIILDGDKTKVPLNRIFDDQTLPGELA